MWIRGMTKYCVLLLFFMLSSILIAPVFAQSDAMMTASDRLIQRLKSFHSLTANFVQQVTDDSGRLVQSAKGKLALIRPNKFYWFNQQPKVTQQKIIADGKRVWIYDIPLKQVTVKSLTLAMTSAPMLLLTGNTRFIRRSYLVHSNSRQVFSMRSRRRGSVFPKIDLWFRGNSIVKMRMLDNLGHTSVIQFSKVVLNPKINRNLFRFRIPRGVDVIR